MTKLCLYCNGAEDSKDGFDLIQERSQSYGVNLVLKFLKLYLNCFNLDLNKTLVESKPNYKTFKEMKLISLLRLNFFYRIDSIKAKIL
jgi:hypothetical protein